MAEPDLSQKSLRDLIVALLMDGRAGRLTSVRAAAVVAELRRRSGQDFGADPKAWCDWFLSALPLDRLQLEFAETRRRIREIERRALRKLRR
jgi:hypothetical protein